MKKWKKLLIIFTIILIIVSIPIIIIIAGLPNKNISWHGLKIVNFENYTGIGAGILNENTASATSMSVTRVNDSNSNNIKLVGIDKNNLVQEIQFEDNDGNMQKQKAKLMHFDSYDKFTIMSFSINKNDEFLTAGKFIYTFSGPDATNFKINLLSTTSIFDSQIKSFKTSDGYGLFILDNKTGKIYDTAEIVEGIMSSYYKDSNNYISEVELVDCQTYYDYFSKSELENCIFFRAKNNKGGYCLYQVKLKADTLEVMEKLNMNQYNNFVGKSFSIDLFNNIVSFVDGGIKWQKPDSSFKSDYSETATYKIGYNSIIYKEDNNNTYYLNKNGEFEKIAIDLDNKLFTIPHSYGDGLTLNNYKFLKKHENTLWVSYGNRFFKINLDTNNIWNHLNFEQIFEDDNLKEVCCQGDYFYWTKDTKLFKVNVNTLEIQEISLQYEISSLDYHKNINTIKFKAIDKSTFLEIDGFLDENGNIIVGDFEGVKKDAYKIYVIKPINK